MLIQDEAFTLSLRISDNDVVIRIMGQVPLPLSNRVPRYDHGTRCLYCKEFAATTKIDYTRAACMDLHE